ncbi:hypothetical protein BDN72DRAFT_322885 [Pluteus cervinus]|uniref:Uncharacterized protein n=1 Tax=Pluteus cervinus TaxID=181527 RepID=A0ACD3AC06_9AGAR|nr:hypothetical protein BDN72DRAFT_322885 [Pluteus cervinus]
MASTPHESPPTRTDTLPVETNGTYVPLIQCQYCLRTKAEVATLSKCAGCRIELYCSKECQKKAWPTHKVKCKLNQKARKAGNEPPAGDRAERLGAFTKAHGHALAEAGLRALEVGIHPENVQELILALTVRERSSTQLERSYYVTGAEVVPFEIFGEKTASDLRAQLKAIDAHRDKKVSDGAFIVTLSDLQHGIVNVSPTMYSASVTYDKPMPWKEWLIDHMNGDIPS